MRPQQELLKKAAEAYGLTVEVFEEDWNIDAIRVSSSEHSEIIIKGAVYQNINRVHEMISDNKQASKFLLNEGGIPVPRSLIITRKTPAKDIQEFLDKHQETRTWVLKPIDGTHGEGVILDLSTTKELLLALQSTPEKYNTWLIEEQVDGEDIRIQAIDGKLVAACRREPAYVLGDGSKTVQELVDERHAFIQTQNPVNHLVIDDQTLEMLSNQGVKPDSIPKEGQKVQLKEVANMSQGAYAIDITDELHPNYFTWTEKVAALFGMKIFAIDALSNDHRKDPFSNAKVLEINARPHWLQHTFSEGRQHDIPTLIIKSLFKID